MAAATAAGWLVLFLVLLVLPPASQPRRDDDAVTGTEPPAVVSVLAGRLDRDGFGVTLADLAAWVPAERHTRTGGAGHVRAACGNAS